MPDAPQYDQNETREQIENLSRRPFRTVLARLLDNAPSDEAIAGQAERNPDRWAQTVALIARLGGFNEKLEVEGSITHKINDLSDAELQSRIAALDMQSSAHTEHPRVDTGPA